MNYSSFAYHSLQSKTAILASGGMDSFLLWALHCGPMYDKPSGVNVFVDVGQKYSLKESLAVNKLVGVPCFNAVSVKAMDLGPYETESGIIPNRNAHLILAAAAYGATIALGVIADEINSDKSPAFLSTMEEVLNISNAGQYWNEKRGLNYKIITPLRNMTKSEAVAAYLATGYPAAWLYWTVSCYSAEEGHCGRCPSCFKRWVALVNNGLDSEAFQHYPPAWASEQGIIRKAYDGTYSQRRALEILDALDKDGYRVGGLVE